MTITGGEGAEINGDVLDLGGLNTGPINYTRPRRATLPAGRA